MKLEMLDAGNPQDLKKIEAAEDAGTLIHDDGRAPLHGHLRGDIGLGEPSSTPTDEPLKTFRARLSAEWLENRGQVRLLPRCTPKRRGQVHF